MVERTNEAYEEGVPLTVMGAKLKEGDPAPEFALENFDPKTSAMSTVTLGESAGRVRLFNVVNSVDTPICHIETQRWDKTCGALPGLELYTVSMDLPFGMARWQTEANVTHTMLSAHMSEEYGREYGVLLKEWRLLQRAVFVVDRNSKIVHAEYVADQMQEPDYDAAMEAAKAALAKSA